MFRPTLRLIARPAALRTVPRASVPTRRLLSTAPPSEKSRSWKSLVARVGLAGAFIYYYNTTDVFAEEPRHQVQSLPVTEEETEQLPTIEAIAQQRQQRKAEAAAVEEAAAAGAETKTGGGIEELEEEADQQGAFNPETGEINWDCPCLGGMADGPCGEDFKAAFSCFVFSTEDPKGMDCVDKFKDMQNCFRQYPEIYGSELETDDEDDVTADRAQADLPAENAPSTTESASEPPTATAEKVADGKSADFTGSTKRANAATEQVKKEHDPVDESDSAIPKAAFDQRDASVEKK